VQERVRQALERTNQTKEYAKKVDLDFPNLTAPNSFSMERVDLIPK